VREEGHKVRRKTGLNSPKTTDESLNRNLMGHSDCPKFIVDLNAV
jgi:hypothetical protein